MIWLHVLMVDVLILFNDGSLHHFFSMYHLWQFGISYIFQIFFHFFFENTGTYVHIHECRGRLTYTELVL